MLTTRSRQLEFDQMLRDRAKIPIEFRVGNPFVPNNRLLLDSPEGLDRDRFTVNRDENRGQRRRLPVDNELVKSLLDNQLEFSSVDLKRRPRNANVLDSYGVSQLNSGNLEVAAGCFREALDIKPDFLPALAHLAKVYLVQGDYERAIELYRRLQERRPRDKQVLINLATIYLQRMELDQATQILTIAVEEGLRDAHAFNALGVSNLLKRDMNKAINWFRRALRENVRFISAQNNLGVTYALLHNYRKAERAFQATLLMDRGNPSAAKNLADLYASRRQYSRAIGVLENYLERRDDDVEARTLLALCLLNISEYDKSEKQLEIAFRRAQENDLDSEGRARFSNNFGAIYHRRGDFENARKRYEEALNQSSVPGRTIFYNLMSLLLEHRRTEELKRIIDRATRFYADDGRVTLHLSGYYIQMNKFEKAIALAREAMVKLPNSVEPHAMLGAILAEIYEDYDGAIATTKEGLVRDPANRMLLNNLAYYYLMKGDVPAGRRVLDGVKVEEDDVHLRATRGLLLLKEGNIREGVRLYGEARQRARADELKSLVLQKKNLELAKIALEDDRMREAEMWLRKILTEKTNEPLFRDQASRLLERMRTKAEE